MSDDLAGFGPFFAVVRHQDPPAAPWRPMAELIDDPEALTARVRKVRSALMGNGEPEIRVAASVAHLGLVARLIAPMIGTAAAAELAAASAALSAVLVAAADEAPSTCAVWRGVKRPCKAGEVRPATICGSNSTWCWACCVNWRSAPASGWGAMLKASSPT